MPSDRRRQRRHRHSRHGPVRESTAALRLACIGLIVTGIIGLKVVTPD
ncbi:MAG: hypothetical protein U1E43_01075 [Rhodospirillales bacterium]